MNVPFYAIYYGENKKNYISNIELIPEENDSNADVSEQSNIILHHIMNYVRTFPSRIDGLNVAFISPTEIQYVVEGINKVTTELEKKKVHQRSDSPSARWNNRCVENVARIHAETAEDRLTQIIFCDLGVPHKATGEAEAEGEDADDAKDKKSIAEVESLEEECDFCVYDDIRDKLIARGIPAEEIAYIHDAKTEQQKSDLFDKVRNGEIRVLLGSTAKMGTGTNVQKRLIAVHDLDIPWRPADLEQRAGRIIRQGNENKNVQIFRYVTKRTFDACHEFKSTTGRSTLLPRCNKH